MATDAGEHATEVDVVRFECPKFQWLAASVRTVSWKSPLPRRFLVTHGFGSSVPAVVQSPTAVPSWKIWMSLMSMPDTYEASSVNTSWSGSLMLALGAVMFTCLSSNVNPLGSDSVV